MKTRSILAVSGLVSALVLIAPTEAEACSCGPYSAVLRPADGEAHPANAGLLFTTDCGGSVDFFSVTVDGTPATFLHDGPTFGFNAFTVADIDPPPAPGQEVVVTQCAEDVEFLSECPPDGVETEVLRYVAGDRDDTTPPGAGDVELTHEEGDFELGCNEADFRFNALITALDQGDETDLLWELTVTSADGSDSYSQKWHSMETPAELATEIYRELAALTGEPEEYCASVSASDLSGNDVIVAEACGSSSTGESGEDSGSGDDGDSGQDGDSGEDGDSGDDDAGDEGESGSGDGGQDDDSAGRGCGCNTTGTPGWSALGFLTLAVVARRRRRR